MLTFNFFNLELIDGADKEWNTANRTPMAPVWSGVAARKSKDLSLCAQFSLAVFVGAVKLCKREGVKSSVGRPGRACPGSAAPNMWRPLCVRACVCVCTKFQRGVWSDDMCYFACKFFGDSPPSEPVRSDSDAGLKTEVCFYD